MKREARIGDYLIIIKDKYHHPESGTIGRVYKINDYGDYDIDVIKWGSGDSIHVCKTYYASRDDKIKIFKNEDELMAWLI